MLHSTAHNALSDTAMDASPIRLVNHLDGTRIDPRPVIHINAPAPPPPTPTAGSSRVDLFKPVYVYNDDAPMVNGAYDRTPMYPAEVAAHEAWVQYWSYMTLGSARRDITVIMRLVSEVPLEQDGADELYSRVLHELVQEGADPNQTDEQGQSLLICCTNMESKYFCADVAMLLIEWGADVTTTFKGHNAMQWLQRHGNPNAHLIIQSWISKMERFRRLCVASPLTPHTTPQTPTNSSHMRYTSFDTASPRNPFYCSSDEDGDGESDTIDE